MSKYKKEELEELLLVKKVSYEAAGRLYEVSGNAIKKAAKRFGIILPAKRTINPSEILFSCFHNVRAFALNPLLGS